MKYTIIVVNYNKEKYLDRCLQSIINQTYTNYRLMIVDDGSTDNSMTIIEKYRKYDNVDIYYKKNGGVSDARNFAIERVKTTYFTFVDSDDYIEPSLLEVCSKYKSYDILGFNSFLVYPDRIIKDYEKGNFVCKNGEEVLYRLIKNKTLFLVPWGYIYNIKLFKNNNLKYPKGLVHEDTILSTICVLKSKKTICIDYYGYNYVQTDNSITRNKNPEMMNLRINSMIYVFENLRDYFYENVKNKEYLEFFLNFYANITLNLGEQLSFKYQLVYDKELRKLKVVSYLKNSSFVSRVKKILGYISPMLYFRVYLYLKRIYNKIRIRKGEIQSENK